MNEKDTEQKKKKKSEIPFFLFPLNRMLKEFCHPLNGLLTQLNTVNQMVCIGMGENVKGSKMQKLDGSTGCIYNL